MVYDCGLPLPRIVAGWSIGRGAKNKQLIVLAATNQRTFYVSEFDCRVGEDLSIPGIIIPVAEAPDDSVKWARPKR